MEAVIETVSMAALTCEEPAAAEAPAEENVEEEDSNDRVIVSGEDIEGAELSEMGSWILNTLHQIQPDTEITLGSVQALSDILDGITCKVLEEAKRISQGDSENVEAPSTAGNQQPLTSLDIHKALKRLLPGEPGDPLRPYLPTVTKQAWHLDKQSLKGIKKQKVGNNNNHGGGAPLPPSHGVAAPPASAPPKEQL